MNNVCKFVYAAVLGLLANQAVAGSLGPTSNDNSTVTLEIPDTVKVSDVADVPLGEYDPTQATLDGEVSFCVFRNGGDNYQLKLTTDIGDFKVGSVTASESIPFSAVLVDPADATHTETLSYDTFTTGTWTGSPAADCNSSDNARLEVSLAQAQLHAASTADDYQAVITVDVAPI